MSDGGEKGGAGKRWELAKSICLYAATFVVGSKVIFSPFSISLDATTLISLLLALFAIWLSALFYFKATEASNAFYDNTYKFTRDVAQLLAKMESGFGERLKNLDEGYASMRNYFQSDQRAGSKDKIEEAEQKLDEEKEELRKTIEARNKIVRDLIESSHLQSEEKISISEKLKEKESELEGARKEISRLNDEILLGRVRSREGRSSGLRREGGFRSYTIEKVVDVIGRDLISEESPRSIRKKFEMIEPDLAKLYISDLADRGFYADGLTAEGVEYLRMLAQKDG